MTLSLFGDGPASVAALAAILDRDHYLGATTRGFGWRDEFGCLVLAPPTARHIPGHWLELSRWCLTGVKNGGSRQWSRVARWLRKHHPTTTVVSYSDPSAGHTGSLYRACNWLWAPTWHRVVPPPTAGGSWDGVTIQAVKDRWIFPLRRDARRVTLLRCDDSYVKRFPWCEYNEPHGADYTTAIPAMIGSRIVAVLTDDLRRAPWKGNANPVAGHCYVASEALWHTIGGPASSWRPSFIRHEGAPHWYLTHKTGRVIDLTAAQFNSAPPYADGRRAAFLTQHPSKRARILMSRLTEITR